MYYTQVKYRKSVAPQAFFAVGENVHFKDNLTAKKAMVAGFFDQVVALKLKQFSYGLCTAQKLTEKERGAHNEKYVFNFILFTNPLSA